MLAVSTSSTKKSTPYHHGDLRASLVAAGIELLEREGVEGLTLRAASRLVGVSHAAPARHFPHADSFLAAIATVGYDRLSDVLLRAGDVADPLVGFLEMGRGYVRFAVEHPHWYRAIFHPSLATKSSHPELMAASAMAFDALRSGIRDAITSGGVRDADLGEVALLTWSTVHGLSLLLIDDQVRPKGYDQPHEALIDSVLTGLFLGLRASASEG
jgi:AcrR family transcriptional regulator